MRSSGRNWLIWLGPKGPRVSDGISAPGETSPFLEILGISWVVRVGGAPDLDVVFDLAVGCAVGFQHSFFALRILDSNREGSLRVG
jgi:hypothetical protein